MRHVIGADGHAGLAHRPAPRPGPRELLVRVAGAGLNAADLLQIAGGYRLPPSADPVIPGIEFSGLVAEVGTDVRRFAPGDAVMSLVTGGAQAEWALADERLTLPVPEEVNLVHAAGFPEAFCCAYDALFTQADLQPGERLLVHGATGGVGVAAVQLAARAGARVTAVVRSPAHRDRLEALGATMCPADDFSDAGPFDVVLELVGATNLAGDVDSLTTGGRIVVIGVSNGGERAEVSLRTMMAKRARLYASTLRNRPLVERAAVVDLVGRMVLPRLAAKEISIPVFGTFPLAEAHAAYELLARPGKFGKILLAAGPRPEIS
jgi:NADPH:quinone reductase